MVEYYGHILLKCSSDTNTHIILPSEREKKYICIIFFRFMENLQAEVIELEFMEFSKGLKTISEEDFARILLRYTMLDKSDVEASVERVRSRIPTEKVWLLNLQLLYNISII